MCQKDTIDGAERDSGLTQAECGAAAAIEEQSHTASLDQCAGPELLQVDLGSNSGAEQDDLQFVC